MQKWAERHPRLSAIGGIIMLIAGGLATLQGIWNLFSNEPLFPYIANNIPFWPRVVLLVVFCIITLFGIGLTIKIFQRTNKNIKKQKQGQTTNETKKLDWVTCDKCGFIGVRNIKTRELEEMEDNQRRTGQPVLIRINQLGDKEPRHEKIPECIMQIQDFSINPPLSSHALPLFYMQLPRQCQHFKKWQKGLTPKEHLESLNKINRIEQPIETASQIFNGDMGKHITKIKNVLEIWKQQLSKMIRRRKLVELRTDIEIKMANKNDFWYFLTHCPSVEKEYEELRARREIYTMHLNPFVIHEDGKEIRTEPKKEHIAEQRNYLNEAMQSLIETIDHSLSMSNEYSKRRCPFCPNDMTKG
jgi:hypothetical protein